MPKVRSLILLNGVKENVTYLEKIKARSVHQHKLQIHWRFKCKTVIQVVKENIGEYLYNLMLGEPSNQDSNPDMKKIHGEAQLNKFKKITWLGKKS